MTKEERLTLQFILNFWSFVEILGASECWEWQGAKVRSGHGVIRLGDRNYRASRISYGLKHGGVPDDLHILHSCDNPPCVNPRHLRAGTHAENMRDKQERGRSKHVGGIVRLNYELAEQLRREYAAGGVTQLELARKYGVTERQVSKTINRQSWKSPVG